MVAHSHGCFPGNHWIFVCFCFQQRNRAIYLHAVLDFVSLTVRRENGTAGKIPGDLLDFIFDGHYLGTAVNMLKRLFDVIVSVAGLFVLSPVLLVAAFFIKLDSRGPVFYMGQRVGKNGKLFKMLKFRTLREDADQMGGGPSCADDDPRITRFGKTLRKYKINELPQLINVLTGEMSFVGPRPEVPSEVETYSPEEKRILTVRPGITDYASLQFHNEGEILMGSADPHQAYREKIKPEKLKLALKYVDERTFWMDLNIMYQTALTIVKSRTNSDNDGIKGKANN